MFWNRLQADRRDVKFGSSTPPCPSAARPRVTDRCSDTVTAPCRFWSTSMSISRHLWFLLWFLPCVFAVMTAQADDAPESRYAGTWSGTLGQSEIRACFNMFGHGEYYYLRHRRPLRLQGEDRLELSQGVDAEVLVFDLAP